MKPGWRCLDTCGGQDGGIGGTGTFPNTAHFLGLQCPQMGQVAYPLNTFRGRHSWCPEDDYFCQAEGALLCQGAGYAHSGAKGRSNWQLAGPWDFSALTSAAGTVVGTHLHHYPTSRAWPLLSSLLRTTHMCCRGTSHAPQSPPPQLRGTIIMTLLAGKLRPVNR